MLCVSLRLHGLDRAHIGAEDVRHKSHRELRGMEIEYRPAVERRSAAFTCRRPLVAGDHGAITLDAGCIGRKVARQLGARRRIVCGHGREEESLLGVDVFLGNLERAFGGLNGRASGESLLDECVQGGRLEQCPPIAADIAFDRESLRCACCRGGRHSLRGQGGGRVALRLWQIGANIVRADHAPGERGAGKCNGKSRNREATAWSGRSLGS